MNLSQPTPFVNHWNCLIQTHPWKLIWKEQCIMPVSQLYVWNYCFESLLYCDSKQSVLEIPYIYIHLLYSYKCTLKLIDLCPILLLANCNTCSFPYFTLTHRSIPKDFLYCKVHILHVSFPTEYFTNRLTVWLSFSDMAEEMGWFICCTYKLVYKYTCRPSVAFSTLQVYCMYCPFSVTLFTAKGMRSKKTRSFVGCPPLFPS